jgi:methionyl-tRNA formyltransferase
VTVRIVFMGTPQFAVPSLQRLADSPHSVVGVVTQPDRPSGRGQLLRPSPIKELARNLGVPVLQPDRARSPEFFEQLRKLLPDIVVVVAYGQILPAAVIAVPPMGCINAHASLLPHLRGAAPIQRAILAGDRETGVTVMRINERMDAGDVLCARPVAIDADDDAASLGAKLASLAADLLLEAVDLIANGKAHWTPQDETSATYAPMVRREETQIDWTLSAEDAERHIRAFRPDPGAFTLHDGVRLKILAAKVASRAVGGPPGTVEADAPEGVCVTCGSGSLILATVQPEGGRAMSALDYFRGRGAGRARVFRKRQA